MAERPKKVIFDVAAGTQEIIEMTDEEIAQMEADAAASEALRLEQEQAEAEREAAKASAISKLTALGLTEDEALALVGQ